MGDATTKSEKQKAKSGAILQKQQVWAPAFKRNHVSSLAEWRMVLGSWFIIQCSWSREERATFADWKSALQGVDEGLPEFPGVPPGAGALGENGKMKKPDNGKMTKYL